MEMHRMTRRDFLTLSTAGAASLLLSGCGSDNGPGTGSGAVLSDAQRNAVLQAVGTHFDALPHQSMDSDNDAVLAFVKSRSEFRAAQLTPTGTVAARFTDGPGFVFINNLDDERDNGRSVFPPASTLQRGASQLPEGSKAVLLNGMGFIPFGPGNPLNQYINQVRAAAHIDRLGEMFQLRGYQVTKDFASIANLRKVEDTDVFYFVGHGGLGVDENDQSIYVINTADSILLTQKDQALEADIKANYVGYAIYAELNNQRQRRSKAAYYITPQFVQHYMRFNKYSLVFINGCAGSPPPTGVTTGIPDPQFHKAFFAAQASAYAGWDDKVNAGDVRDSAEFFFDRLLGAGISDVPGVQKEPPVRPFDYSTVWSEMRATQRSGQSFPLSQSLDSDPPKPGEPARRIANFNVLPNTNDPDTFAILAPSIQNLEVSEATQVLTILGRFGTIEGTVTLNGQALTVKEWTTSQITCTLPDTGGGDVIVGVNGRTSNPRRLTEWVLPLHYRGVGTGADSHTETADFALRLRADTQSYRISSSAAPTTTNLSQVAFVTASSSSCRYSLSGTFSGKFGDGLVHELTWAGAGSLTPWNGNGSNPAGGYFLYDGDFDFNAQKLLLGFVAAASQKITDTIPAAPGVVTKIDWIIQSSFFGAELLTLPLDDQYAIPSGSLTGAWPGSSLSGLPNMNLTLTWDRTPPTAGTEPDTNSARSISAAPQQSH
jgi:hypothetical protein